MCDNENQHIDVSVIIPIYNGAKWINDCCNSILQQTANDHLNLQVCICDDASTDNSSRLLKEWRTKFLNSKIDFELFSNLNDAPKGVGYAKNRAVAISKGTYLCFQDIDDLMLPDRILLQFNLAKDSPNNTLIGCKFKREPETSTNRYTKWANSLNVQQLNQQVYTSHGPTVIMPTWFCHKELYSNVGGFSEDGQGTPEDLLFFYQHLNLGGKVARVDEVLVIYTYHQEATTFTIKEETIWKIRLEQLEKAFLNKWTNFTIWNAGKQGRQFYNSLSKENTDKVVAFCDVDVKKITRQYTPYDPIRRKAGKSLDIVHFSQAQKPFVICVKLDLTSGNFERNLESLHLEENKDYVFFS